MKALSKDELDALWSRHHAEWRDPAQIASQWREAAATDTRLLRYTAQGAWWDILATTGITLLVTREYEHLVIAIGATGERPVLSYMPLPHPSGLVVNRKQHVIHIASTRNPNQIYDLLPVTGHISRLDVQSETPSGAPLIPVRSHFYPGCLYMHDLALINEDLFANAVGQNAVVRLNNGRYERVWWPRCIETEHGPVFGQNHLQLNSIASGSSLAGSYFSASADKLSARRPGHQNFPVDKRGVIFSGQTREPIAHGLTRPHSARLYCDRIWVDNSGYGELGFVESGQFISIARLPGWTRGLCFHKELAFVGVSRIIPRFRQYAPGLEVETSKCGVFAIDINSGQVVGSLTWPHGNQVFAIDWISNQITTGFPFPIGTKRATAREKVLFYTFKTEPWELNHDS